MVERERPYRSVQGSCSTKGVLLHMKELKFKFIESLKIDFIIISRSHSLFSVQPRLQRAETEDSDKGKTLSAQPYPLPHRSQMEPRNRPISAPPGANQSLYSYTLDSSSLVRLRGETERDTASVAG